MTAPGGGKNDTVQREDGRELVRLCGWSMSSIDGKPGVSGNDMSYEEVRWKQMQLGHDRERVSLWNQLNQDAQNRLNTMFPQQPPVVQSPFAPQANNSTNSNNGIPSKSPFAQGNNNSIPSSAQSSPFAPKEQQQLRNPIQQSSQEGFLGQPKSSFPQKTNPIQFGKPKSQTTVTEGFGFRQQQSRPNQTALTFGRPQPLEEPEAVQNDLTPGPEQDIDQLPSDIREAFERDVFEMFKIPEVMPPQAFC